MKDGSDIPRSATGQNFKEKIDNFLALRESIMALANLVSIQSPGTALSSRGRDTPPHLVNTMFFSSEDSAEFQVEVHPSSYLVDQEIEDNADEEDKHALARAYAQVKELKNAIKRKKPARFDGVEIPTHHPHNAPPSNPAPVNNTASTSKNPTLSNKNIANPPPRNNAANPSNSKPQSNSTPQFHYQSGFDKAATTKCLMSQVLGAKIEISTQDLLAVSPEIHKQIKEMAMTKKIAIGSLETTLETSSSSTWASYEQYLVKDTEGKCEVGDPLTDLPVLPYHPLPFVPGSRFTVARAEELDLDPAKFLWPLELELVQWLVQTHETAFTWETSEQGTFREDMFPPLKIPMLPHKPWVKCNIPIPPTIFCDVIQIIKEKIATGIYKPSTLSYQSKWFCVVKKDRKSLCLVHDLQPLNAVSIQDSAVPPFIDSIAKAFTCHSVYGILDLMVGYDHHAIHNDYYDLTTFQTPIGTLQLTKLPMGYTNAMQIFHGDVCWILKDKIPEVTIPFIDDCPIKGLKSCYQSPDGTFKTIPQNGSVQHFIWEHLQNTNHILHQLCHAGATVSAKKCVITTPSIVVVGHKVSYEGRIPNETKVQKIKDWPYCTNVTEVRGFLGLCSYCCIFIKDFAKHARPLIELTKKDVPFEFGDEHRVAMEYLKTAIVASPAL
ncbi:hypothetical protein PISMIDRAFT_14158 [Pisolithus microcarpus 441]|uniref:DUF4100 domain-containing protein n=1 Tax=Pisolithus microcarpus 441 TaxID=765257 RepID=A0A0C9ZFG3_9AGAM|nr:hypothetical protein PISMIDRAFT_14158 [Pisolithus microcarpus 441]